MLKIDELYKAVEEKGNVCVGLDTAPEYLPQDVLSNYDYKSLAVLAYNKAVIDATRDSAVCYKVQIAYYESLGIAGLSVYSETLKYIRKRDCISIADIKRGDIADTAARYAKAHYNGDFEADFVTLNAYMGMDTLTPWIDEAARLGKGAFVLLRTSNSGRNDFECAKLENGKMLYETAGAKLQELAALHKGACGYGSFGAVAGCTDSQESAAIRKNYDRLFLLIPGYGSQGGGAAEAALLLDKNGNGGIVNSSRAILKAWEAKDPSISTLQEAALAANLAAITMRDEIRAASKQVR
ncbi:orotidine 5'-phosphate decarboxylase [Spirochaetia bacterium]|nr:orotidine 5'-phosphate decarboxylase [Spirochaetia bacterium]